MPKDIAASIRQKLRDLARTRHEDFDYVLHQYATQRLLYRLGCSEHSNKFFLQPVYQSIAENQLFQSHWLNDELKWKGL